MALIAPLWAATTYTTPGNATYTVASGVDYVTVKIWGAGGGSANGGKGGAGGYITATYTVTAGQTIAVRVGQGGSGSPESGGGGEASAVTLPGSTTAYISAGGGGGAGGTDQGAGDTIVFDGHGGAGGAPNGQNGGPGIEPTSAVAGGATPTVPGAGGFGSGEDSEGGGGPGHAGGTGGTANGGSPGFWGDNHGENERLFQGGGGGGGLRGGGGGGSGPSAGGGGGGGGGSSGVVVGTQTPASVTMLASSNGYSAPNTADADYPVGTGVGGSGLSAGGNGAVVIVSHLSGSATAPSITTQPQAQLVVAGTNVTFTVAATGTAPLSYQWRKASTPISGATTAMLTLSNVQAADAANYDVVVTNTAGSATSTTASLTLATLPAFTTQPVSVTLTAGQTATFTAAASGTPAPTYQWRKGGTTLSGATAVTLTLTNVQSANTGTYDVVASNLAGSVTSATATLSFPVAPAITTQPSNQTVNAGSTATFTVVATGAPAPTYQWRKGGSTISGATLATLTLTNVQTTHAGSYDVVVTNGSGSVTSSAATLSVTVAPTITAQPSSATVSAGQTATFSVTASGTPAPAYQWRKAGAAISGATTATLTLSNVQSTEAGSYDVVITNTGGTVTSNSVTLSLGSAPASTTTYATPGNVTYTVPSAMTSLTLKLWGAGGGSANGGKGGAGGYITATYTVTAGQTIAVRVGQGGSGSPESGSGGEASAVTLPGSTTAYISAGGGGGAGGTDQGAGDTIVFDGHGGAGGAPNGQNGGPGIEPTSAVAGGATPTTPGTGGYGSGEDSSGGGGPGHAGGTSGTANGGSPGFWGDNHGENERLFQGGEGGGGLRGGGGGGSGHSGGGGGGGGGGSSGVVAGSQTPGGIAMLASGNGYSAPNATDTNYPAGAAAGGSNRGAGGNGAVVILAYAGGVNVAPSITTQPASQSVVVGASVTFSAVVDGYPVPTYQWKKDGVAISGATNLTFSLSGVSGSDAATYTVVATNSQGTATSTGAVLAVTEAPAITTAPLDQTVLAGGTATFNVVASGTPAPTLQWKKNGVNISGATNATLTLTNVGTGDTATYTVVATNSAGSATSPGAGLTVTISGIVGPVAQAATNWSMAGSFTANWTALAGATNYRLDVATDSTFSTFVAGYTNLSVGNTTSYSVATNIDNHTTYYYRVRADTAGGISGNSNATTVSYFSVILAPQEATGRTATGFVVSWFYATPDRVARLDVATDNAFTNFVPGYQNLAVGYPGATCPVTGLQADVAYYYRLRTESTVTGTTTINSGTMVVGFVPPAMLPATNWDTTSFVANWSPVPGATNYRIDVSTVPDFSSYFSTYNNLSVGNVTSVAVVGTYAYSAYFYRVRAERATGTSANPNTLPVNYFQAVPVGSPASGRTATEFMANWNYGGIVVNARLDVATDSAFANFLPGYQNLAIVGYPGVQYGNCLVTGLRADVTYYYRVRAESPVTGATTINTSTITVGIIVVPTVIAWSNPSAITYGTALSGTQLNATANISGTFAYSPAAGVVLAAGNQPMSVTFTATNPGFANATKAMILTVNKAPLTITADNVTRIYGAANPALTVSFSGLVNGETSSVVTGLASTTAAGTASPVGTYAITPAGGVATNYALTFVPGTLTITIAPQTVTATAGASSSPSGNAGAIVAMSDTPTTFTASGASTGTYQWKVDGVVQSETSGTLTTNFTGSGAHVVTVIATGTTNYAPSTPATFNVKVIPGSIATGASHVVALKKEGTVWTWGGNSAGQLGDGTTTLRTAPAAVSGATGVRSIAAGDTHSLLVKADGTVWAWGGNSAGQLGDNTLINRTTPVQVPGLTGFADIAAGASHTLALRGDGTVWAWGSNTAGQLGDASTTSRPTPAQVAGLAGVKRIAAAGDYSVAVTTSGAVWAWGKNDQGQLGDGTTTNRTTPVQLTSFASVVEIAAGAGHVVALDSIGTLWSWGGNGYGELGDGTVVARLSPVPVMGPVAMVAAASGATHSAAVKSDGSVSLWGRNQVGQLADGTTTNRSLAAQLSGLTGIVAVTARGDHTIALKSDGTIWTWGGDGFGQTIPNLRLNQVALRLTASVDDSDGDGMLDSDELKYFGNLSHGGAVDTDGDGLTDVQELYLGTDPALTDTDGDSLNDLVDPLPLDYYNGQTPSLAMVGGNNQSAYTSQFNAQPFDVAVWNTAGTTPLVNAPVTFLVTQGGGGLAITKTTGTPTFVSLTLRTDIHGTAQLYYKHPTAAGVVGQITATAGAATPLVFQSTSLAQLDSDGDGIGDSDEIPLGTDPYNADTDGDGVPDGWEVRFGTNPKVNDASADPDGDGLTNLQEYLLGRNPLKGAVSDTTGAVNLRIYFVR
jgi:alpha-tubulin suppressor-like RCC1 family protein